MGSKGDPQQGQKRKEGGQEGEEREGRPFHAQFPCEPRPLSGRERKRERRTADSQVRQFFLQMHRQHRTTRNASWMMVLLWTLELNGVLDLLGDAAQAASCDPLIPARKSSGRSDLYAGLVVCF